MRLKVRDLAAMLVVAAIAVPYVGYLIDGDVPLVQDARGMSAVGLLLGAAAFAVLVGGNKRDRVGKIETGLAMRCPQYWGRSRSPSRRPRQRRCCWRSSWGRSWSFWPPS